MTDPIAARAREAAFDPLRFSEARMRVLSETAREGGIGRLSEKALHRILKLYFEPDEDRHEVRRLGSVADILNDRGVTEIQTRSFARLVPKLEKFLPHGPVTVVYPLPYTKVLRWIDPQSGEISPPHKSPKKATVFDAFFELYNIRAYLSDPHFSLVLLFLNVEEYRYRDGYGKERKYRSTRMERIPNSIEKMLVFHQPADYLCFLPDGLPDRFTMRDVTAAISPRFRHAYSGVKILSDLNLIGESGKIGRARAYALLSGQSR